MQYVSFMLKMTKYILHVCYPAHANHRYSNMHVKRCVRTLGIETNAIKLVLKGLTT